MFCVSPVRGSLISDIIASLSQIVSTLQIILIISNYSRPGRPPKRMTPITTFANMPNPDPTFLGAMSNSAMGGIPFPPPHPRDMPPGFNPFLPLGGSPASQAAQLAQHAQVGTNKVEIMLIAYIEKVS